jgi:hypothetical protein
MAAALDEVLHDLRWGPEQMASAMERMFGGASAAAIEGEPQATAVTAGAAGNAPEAAPPVSAVSGDGTRPLLLAATQVSGEGTSIMAPPRSVRWPLYGALALAAVGSAVAWRGVRRSGPPREEIAAAAPARPPERAAKSPTPARPAEVSATIRSLPSGAEVRVDGDEAAAGRTPVTLRLPASDGRRRVTLRAPGYRPLTLDVDGASDSQVAVALERLGPPPARPAQPARRKHADSGRAVLQGEVFDPFAATPAK